MKQNKTLSTELSINSIITSFSSSKIMNYGKELQNEIANFTDSILSQTTTKELLDTTQSLEMLHKAMKDTERKRNGKLGIFQKIKYMFVDKIDDFKTATSNALQLVNKVEDKLKEQQSILVEDAKSYDKMQLMSAKYLESLDKLILSGEEKIQAAKKYLKRQNSKDNKEEIQKAYNSISSFEHRLADLNITKSLVKSQIPSMEIAKRSNIVQTNKIDVILNNTIPIWKQGMVMSLYQAHSDYSAKNVKLVTDMTNQLLKDNADNNKEISKRIAIENERPIIDPETIEYNNKKLLETITELTKIIKQGKIDRINMIEKLKKNNQDTALALSNMVSEELLVEQEKLKD